MSSNGVNIRKSFTIVLKEFTFHLVYTSRQVHWRKMTQVPNGIHRDISLQDIRDRYILKKGGIYMIKSSYLFRDSCP